MRIAIDRIAGLVARPARAASAALVCLVCLCAPSLARDAIDEGFEAAQWALLSSAGNALQQLGLRAAAGSPDLAALVRKRQDLMALANQAEAALAAAASQPGGETRMVGLRGEIAYTFSPDGAGPNYRRSGVYMVLGGDRTFAERLNVNVQYIYRFVDGWQDPTQVAGSLQQGLALRNAAISNQRYRNQHGVTARVAYRWPGDKFETELSAIFNATALDGLVRTRFVYKATDQLRLSIGGDWFFGNEDTYLGEFRRNSGAFLEVRYGY